MDGSLNVTGDTNIDGSETVNKNLTVNGDTNLHNTYVDGTLQVNDNATFAKDVEIQGNETVKGDLTVEGKLNLKDTVVDGTLQVNDDAMFEKDVEVGGSQVVKKNFTVEGDTNLMNTNVGGDLHVAGDSNIDGSQVINKNLTVNGDSNFKGNVEMAKDLHVAGDATVDGTLSAQDIKLPGGSLNGQLRDIDNRMNKVGAGAAALAGLHYHDYRPGQKFNMAMGVGNYKDKTAMAVGGQYHFDRNTSVNLAATYGNGENMVAGGITFSFGTPKSEYQKDNDALRRENRDLEKRLRKLENWAEKFSLIDQKKSAFPDIPNDHWARNSVETLKGNGFVEGYPDGEFKGDRQMSRYEYAQMLFRALSRGAKVEKSHLQEYAPELRQVEADAKKAAAQKAAQQASAPSNAPANDNAKYMEDLKMQEAGQSYNNRH